VNNLLNGLMAYRQRAQQRGQMQPQGRPMGGFHPMGQPGMPSTPGGYDSSGINPGGGMPHPMASTAPTPMGGPMKPPDMPSMPAPPPQMGAPMHAPPLPPSQVPAGGGYDSSGINPSAGRPFQLQGGFASPMKPPADSAPISIRPPPVSF
jgi:hypothetical protein